MTVFTDPAAYDDGIGRWSRPLARELVNWLAAPRDARWLDAGCGTGAVSAAILDLAWPGAVTGIDPATAYLERARDRVAGARFLEGSATELPFASPEFDVTVASLLMSSLPEPGAAVAELARVTVPGGVVAITVWEASTYPSRDYWDAVGELGLPGADRDPRARRPNDQRSIHEALGGASLRDIHTHWFDVTAGFETFGAFWNTVIRQGHAAPHLESLSGADRDRLQERVAARLGAGAAPVTVGARAWAARGFR